METMPLSHSDDLPRTDDDRKLSEALSAEGYTSRRGAVAFCLLLAVIGALVGSVVFAILWNMLVPGTAEWLATAVGAAVGAGVLVMVGLVKIRRGNFEARELVEDKAWRRQMLRNFGR